jgi:hypothetical protein
VESWNAEALGLVPDADGKCSIVIFDEDLAPRNETPDLARSVALAHGGQMGTFTLHSGQVLDVGRTFGVREP